jgi:hypothetical protein
MLLACLAEEPHPNLGLTKSIYAEGEHSHLLLHLDLSFSPLVLFPDLRFFVFDQLQLLDVEVLISEEQSSVSCLGISWQ